VIGSVGMIVKQICLPARFLQLSAAFIFY